MFHEQVVSNKSIFTKLNFNRNPVLYKVSLIVRHNWFITRIFNDPFLIIPRQPTDTTHKFLVSSNPEHISTLTPSSLLESKFERLIHFYGRKQTRPPPSALLRHFGSARLCIYPIDHIFHVFP